MRGATVRSRRRGASLGGRIKEPVKIAHCKAVKRNGLLANSLDNPLEEAGMSGRAPAQVQASLPEGIDFSAFRQLAGTKGLGLSKAPSPQPAGAEPPPQAGDTAASPSHALPFVEELALSSMGGSLTMSRSCKGTKREH